MGQTSISIRIDEDIKKDAENLFATLGLNLSSAVNIFFRQAVREQAIPFQIRNEPKADTSLASRNKALGEVFRHAQEQSVINGTDDMTMDEINELIAAVRKERRAE